MTSSKRKIFEAMQLWLSFKMSKQIHRNENEAMGKERISSQSNEEINNKRQNHLEKLTLK